MKILMLSHGYPPVISGVTLVVQKVAREMVRRGHEVTVVTASDRGPAYEDQDQGVKLMRVHSRPNPFWSEGRFPIISYDRLIEIVMDVEPDVINTHDSALLSVHLHRLERDKCHVPELLTCHYLPRFVTYYVHAGNVVQRVVEDIAWDVTMRMINGFDHVIFPTQTQQQAFIEEGLNKPSTVISNGLDTGRYNPTGPGDEEYVVARYDLPPGPRVLVVGRLAKDKKIDVVVRAMKDVTSSQEAYLLLVGRGDDRERLEELVDSLDLREYVRFLGFVPEEDLPALYRYSDIFAIASDVEVQSIPTLQAAATGLPIVAVEAAALPELVQNNTNGHLVPPDDPNALATAIRHILDNPDLAKRLGEASLEIGRRHADEETFDAYEKLYRAYSQKIPARC
ncbi:MAG: glycosyltransferase [Anaerolineae bacterium]|jgi:1,2-diacylglycerol 3-alpha-glucosyltransferase